MRQVESRKKARFYSGFYSRFTISLSIDGRIFRGAASTSFRATIGSSVSGLAHPATTTAGSKETTPSTAIAATYPSSAISGLRSIASHFKRGRTRAAIRAGARRRKSGGVSDRISRVGISTADLCVRGTGVSISASLNQA